MESNYIPKTGISFTKTYFVNIINFTMCETFKWIKASGGLIAKGWSADSCRNLFGQMMVSEAAR